LSRVCSVTCLCWRRRRTCLRMVALAVLPIVLVVLRCSDPLVNRFYGVNSTYVYSSYD
jgi:hypothetical protein